MSRSIADPRRRTGRLARGTRQRRRVERAQLGTIFRRETPFAEPFSGRFRSARPRARPPMSGRARASSPVARRAHDVVATALTLCISAYVLWVLAVRFPLVRRARPRVSRDPETRHPFSRRADRARALARSPSRTRAPPITHAVLPSALPRAPSPPERHPTQLGISATHHLNRAPSRGSRTSARARRGFQARSSRGASPATRPRRGFSRFCARTSPPRSASSRRTR